MQTWDDGLALVAAGYADQCIWEHNPDVQNELGENLFITTGTLNVNKSMAWWYAKNHDSPFQIRFHCGSSACTWQ